MNNKIKEWENQLVFDGLSKKTVKLYINIIKNIVNKYNIDINNLNNEIIVDLILKIREKLSDNSVNIYIITLKKWKAYTKQEYDLPKLKSVEAEIPEYFTEDYFLNEIAPAIKILFREEIKIKTLFYLLFYTGLRVGELCNLKKTDFNLKECSINIQKRKSKNPIVVYYPKSLNDILELHFTNNPEDEKVFNIDSACVTYYCNILSKNLNKKLYPHLFRHSFAIMFLRKGGDISVLKELLGHKDLNSTLIYTKMNKSDIEKEYRKRITIKRRPKS